MKKSKHQRLKVYITLIYLDLLLQNIARFMVSGPSNTSLQIKRQRGSDQKKGARTVQCSVLKDTKNM